MEEIVENVFKVLYKEPVFFVDFIKITRNFQIVSHPTFLKKTSFTRWKVQGESLCEPIRKEENINILFSGESYIFQVRFLVENKNEQDTKAFLFYWTGEQALKGYSPLPPGVDKYHPMDRYRQWSELSIFFNCFSNNVLVFCGQENCFDKEKPHLFLLRGELPREMHMYDVLCERKSLRSKTSFLLVCPKEKMFIYWYGLQSTITQRTTIKKLMLHKILQNFEKSWEEFSVLQLLEKSENKIFLEIIQGKASDYVIIESHPLLETPKMYYLNSISGSFSATEVEYPLRSENIVPAYPFLQSHLSTSGIFLIDVDSVVWLWIAESINDVPELESHQFKTDIKNAKKFAEIYVEKKSKTLGVTVLLKYVKAREETLEFKNIFPFWN